MALVRFRFAIDHTTTLSNDRNEPSVWERSLTENTEHARYVACCTKAFNLLVDNDVLIFIRESEANGHRMHNSRVFDEIKHAGTPSAFVKSLMVVQVFNDKSHWIMTGVHTVQRAMQHLLLSQFGVRLCIFLLPRYISQTYTQPKLQLHRVVYFRPLQY